MPSVGRITLFLVLLGILGLGGFNPTKFSLSESACAVGCCAYVNCYQDLDNDGVAVGQATSQCASPGCPTTPNNYISSPSNNPATNPDCDDHNSSVGTVLPGGYTSPCPASSIQIPASGPPTINMTYGGVNYGNCTWSQSGGQWYANCPYGTCSFTCGPYNPCAAAQSCPSAPSGCGYAGGSVPNGSCGLTSCSSLPYPSSSNCPTSCGYGGGTYTGANGCSVSCPATCACAGTCLGNSQCNQSPAGTVPLYRAYSNGNGHHFYTTSLSEYLNAYYNLGFNGDGLYWNSGFVYSYAAPGTEPLYRWYSPSSGDHYYSLSSATCCGYYLEETQAYVMASNMSGTQYLAEWWNGYDHFYSNATSVPQGSIGSYNYENYMGFVYMPNNPQTVPNGSCGTTTCAAINCP